MSCCLFLFFSHFVLGHFPYPFVFLFSHVLSFITTLLILYHVCVRLRMYFSRADGDLGSDTIGCAITFKNWIQGQMNTIASAVRILSLVPLLGAVYSICMVFKRKAEDVLPEKYVRSALETADKRGNLKV